MSILRNILFLGSFANWDAANSKGKMIFDLNTCNYFLIVLDLTKNYDYQWEITIDNEWTENYGCIETSCTFRTNSVGAIRMNVHPGSKPGIIPYLFADYNVAECGDGICEPGEACETCPEDCGYCRPSFCGGLF